MFMKKYALLITTVLILAFGLFGIFGLNLTYHAMNHETMGHEQQQHPCPLMALLGSCMTPLQHIDHFNELFATALPIFFLMLLSVIVGFLITKRLRKELYWSLFYRKRLTPLLIFETQTRDTSLMLRSFSKLHSRLYA